MDAVRARGGRAGRRCSRGRGVRQDALRDPVSPALPLSNLQVCFVGSWSVLKVGSFRLRVCRGGGTIQRAVRRMAGGRRRPGAASADPGTGDASASASTTCSGVGFRFPYDQSLRMRSRFCHLSVAAQFLCNLGSSFEDCFLLRSKTLARICGVVLCIG